MLDIVASYDCMQFQGKLMKQTLENDKKPSLGTDFGTFWPKFGRPFFPPLKNLSSPVSRYYGQLPACTISEKTNDPILRKLSDRRTYGQRDGQTERRTKVIS